MLTAVTGINWGDEGKGRVIDMLAEKADIIVRPERRNKRYGKNIAGRFNGK